MTRLLLSLAALALVAGPALADVPPEPGYVEKCTVKNHAKDGKECILCTDPWHEKRDACEVKHAKDGYTKACKTRGASTWDEVWCRPAAGKPAGDKPATDKPAEEAKKDAPKEEATQAAPAETKKSGGCSGAPAGPAGALLGVALWGLAASRRRQA